MWGEGRVEDGAAARVLAVAAFDAVRDAVERVGAVFARFGSVGVLVVGRLNRLSGSSARGSTFGNMPRRSELPVGVVGAGVAPLDSRFASSSLDQLRRNCPICSASELGAWLRADAASDVLTTTATHPINHRRVMIASLQSYV